MIDIIGFATFAVCAILFLIFKLGDIRRVLYFDIYIDLGTTVLLTILLSGTASGMFTALIAGAMISVILYVLKRTIGYDKPTRKGWIPATRPLDGIKLWVL